MLFVRLLDYIISLLLLHKRFNSFIYFIQSWLKLSFIFSLYEVKDFTCFSFHIAFVIENSHVDIVTPQSTGIRQDFCSSQRNSPETNSIVW